MKRFRNSYSVKKKLEVIEYSEANRNRPASRVYDINEKQIRSWRKDKELLLVQNPNSLSRRKKETFWPELETELKNWILAERERGLQISETMVRQRALIIAKNLNMEKAAEFKAGSSWCKNFMRRKRLSMRSRTSVGQSLPSDWQLKTSKFLKYCAENKIGVDYRHLGNMNEIPVSFDMPSNQTVNEKGAKSVKIVTTGNEKTNFTVILSVTADGGKLPAFVIFKRKTQIRKEEFPNGVIVKVNPKGWINSQLMIEWIDEVWRRRPNSFFSPPSLLVIDSAKAHLTDQVKNKIKSYSKLAVIPGGLTKILQPLDISVNRSFKSKLREKWSMWMSNGLHTFTNNGKMKRASYSEICKWIKDSWDEVNIDCIIGGFVHSRIINSIDQQIQMPISLENLDNINEESNTSDYSEEFNGFE